MDPKYKEISLHVRPESNTVCTHTREVVVCTMSFYFFQQFEKLMELFLLF